MVEEFMRDYFDVVGGGENPDAQGIQVGFAAA